MKMPSPRRVQSAITKAANARSFEKRDDAWFSIVKATNSGCGDFDEMRALAQHHRLIGFDALKALGFSDDETHEFDWHLWPTETPLAFVAAGIAAHSEVAEARAKRLPFDMLVRAVIAQARHA
jgi:hypothetical protein